MSWFLIALIAPFIWSIINHVDKYLISKYFKGGGIGALMIFVGIIAIFIVPIIGFFYPDVLSVSVFDISLLLATGLLYNVAVILYLYALEKEDASVVVPFWQLSPVFAYFFGVALLGEFLEPQKILAGIIVLAGALLLSLKLGEGKFSIRRGIALMMIISGISLALGNTLFKLASVEDYPFWISMFWNQVGMVMFGLICFLVPNYRKQFFITLKENSSKILGINIVEQIGETVGIVINNYAMLLAPVALVVLIEYSVQPLFVFVEGILLTLLFPKFIKEDITKGNLAIKFISIIIMGIGVYFITT